MRGRLKAELELREIDRMRKSGRWSDVSGWFFIILGVVYGSLRMANSEGFWGVGVIVIFACGIVLLVMGSLTGWAADKRERRLKASL